MQENALINPNRGSPKSISCPIYSVKSWRAVKGWGEAFWLLPAAGVSGAHRLLNPLPSLRGQGIIHIL